MTGQAKHTAGSWAVVHDKGEDYSVCAFEGDPRDPRDGIIADVICEIISSEEEADARLIAAAPELMEARQALTFGPPELLESIGYADEGELIGCALAVIAKAEGR